MGIATFSRPNFTGKVYVEKNEPRREQEPDKRKTNSHSDIGII
jgi:hypothetical protein